MTATFSEASPPEPHSPPYKLRLRHRQSPCCSNSVHSNQTPPSSRRRKRDNGDDASTYTGTDVFYDGSTSSTSHQHQHQQQSAARAQGTRQGLLDRLIASAPRNKRRRRRSSPSMSGAGGKWREEQILIICPGSRTTMAQLGCSELTPPTHRIPTRMFKDGDEWRPYYTFKRTKVVNGVEQEEWVEDVDEDKDAVYPLQGMSSIGTRLDCVQMSRLLCDWTRR